MSPVRVFMCLCFTALTVCTGERIGVQRTGKGVEGNGRGLISGGYPTFAFTDWGYHESETGAI